MHLRGRISSARTQQNHQIVFAFVRFFWIITFALPNFHHESDFCWPNWRIGVCACLKCSTHQLNLLATRKLCLLQQTFLCAKYPNIFASATQSTVIQVRIIFVHHPIYRTSGRPPEKSFVQTRVSIYSSMSQLNFLSRVCENQPSFLANRFQH